MTSNGTKNHRYFDIGAATRGVIAYLLDNYEYLAIPKGWNTFPCRNNKVCWQEGVTCSEVKNAFSYVEELGAMKFVKHREAVELNGGKDHWQSDNSLFCYIDLEKLKNPAIVAQMMPLYSERKWSSNPKLSPDKIEEFDEDCRQVREDWAKYVNYLITKKAAAAEDIAAEDIAAAPVESAENKNEKIEKGIIYSILSAIHSAHKNRNPNLTYGTKAGLGYGTSDDYKSILPDAVYLVKKYGYSEICRFIGATVYTHLISSKTTNPAPFHLFKQIDKLKGMNERKAADALAYKLKEFEVLRPNFRKLPDEFNPLNEKKAQPQPLTPVAPVAPVAPTLRGAGKVETRTQNMSIDEMIAAKRAAAEEGKETPNPLPSPQND